MGNIYKKSIGINGCQESFAKELSALCFTNNGDILPEFKTNPKQALKNWANNVINLMLRFHEAAGKETIQIKRDDPNILECQEGSTKLVLRIVESDGKIAIAYISIRGKGRARSLYTCPVDSCGNLITPQLFSNETNSFSFTCSRFLFEPLVEKGLWFKKINAAFGQEAQETREILQAEKDIINPARLVLDFDCVQICEAITNPNSTLFIHSPGLSSFKEFLSGVKGTEKLAALFLKCLKTAGINPYDLMLNADKHVNDYTGQQPTQPPEQTLRALNLGSKGRTIITNDLICEFSNARLRTGLPRKQVLERLKTSFNNRSICKNPDREFDLLHYKMPSQGNETVDTTTVDILRSVYKGMPIKYTIPGDILYDAFRTKMQSGQFKASDLFGISQRFGLQISRKSIETIYRNLENQQGVIPIDLARKILEILAP